MFLVFIGVVFSLYLFLPDANNFLESQSIRFQLKMDNYIPYRERNLRETDINIRYSGCYALKNPMDGIKISLLRY